MFAFRVSSFGGKECVLFLCSHGINRFHDDTEKKVLPSCPARVPIVVQRTLASQAKVQTISKADS